MSLDLALVGVTGLDLRPLRPELSALPICATPRCCRGEQTCEALAGAGVNIEMISTSEIRISVLCLEADVPGAVAAVHSAFELDAIDEQATVYGGTGR